MMVKFFWGLLWAALGLAAEPPSVLKKHFNSLEPITFTVREVQNRKVVVQHAGNRGTIPASTLKVLTVSIALNQLTPKKTFTTMLKYSGSIQNGRLIGDLIVEGSGDPAFGSGFFGKKFKPESIFSDWATSLSRKGVKKVSGCVRALSAFPDDKHPNRYALYEDLGNYFAGTTSGLCYRDNQYAILLKGSAMAGIPIVVMGTEPKYTGIRQFINDLVTGPGNSSDEAYILGAPYSDRRYLQGTYPAGKKEISIRGALPYPAYTCVRELGDYLKNQAGIVIESADCNLYPEKEGDTIITEREIFVLDKHESPPLRELARYILKHSDNNYSDQLLVLLGGQAERKGSRASGIEVMEKAIRAMALKAKNFKVVDGSGLSRVNWVTGNFMSEFLAWQAGQAAFPVLQESLLGGNPHDSRSLLAFGKRWEGRLWIKSGYLEGVSTFTGYLKGKSGKLYSFYFSMNHTDRPGGLKKIFGKMLAQTASTL